MLTYRPSAYEADTLPLSYTGETTMMDFFILFGVMFLVLSTVNPPHAESGDDNT